MAQMTDIIISPEDWEAYQTRREKMEKEASKEIKKIEKEKQKTLKAKTKAEKKAAKKQAKEQKAKEKAQKKEAGKAAVAPTAKAGQQTSAIIEMPAGDAQATSAPAVSSLGVTSVVLLLGACIAFICKLRSENR